MSSYCNRYTNNSQQLHLARQAIARLKGIKTRNSSYSYTRGDSTSTSFGHSSQSCSSHYQSWCGSNGVNSYEPIC